MWININTAGTFVLHADIRYECFKAGIELPGVLTDEVLAANGYMPVTKVTPVYDPITQGLSAQPCISNNGVWEQHFVPYPLDPAIVANNCQMLTDIPESAQVVLHEAGLLDAALAKAKENRIPKQVTMRQARLALLGAGLLDDVEAAIASAGPASKIEWDYAAEVQRSSGLVPAMAAALGMTDTQIDDLFIAAAKL